jgi:hypothetical protein
MSKRRKSMNEIAFSLGSFVGALVFGALTWKLGAFITLAVTKKPRLATYLGSLLSCWYALTRDDTAGRWGATLAIGLLLLAHLASENRPPDDPAP